MTDVSLREYIESRITEQEKRWIDRFESMQRAVDAAADQMNRRLEGMNEFRDAIKDQATRMATKDELVKVDEAVQALQRAKSNLDGRLFIIGAVAGTVCGILSALLVSWLS